MFIIYARIFFIYYQGGIIADQLTFKEIESAYKAGN
jgi:hypothetical protein